MKRKISISVDDETLAMIAKVISSKKFRNRSHAVEYAIQQEYAVQQEYMTRRLEQSSKRTTQDLRLLEARR